jgi:hypothetical protein
MRLEATSEIKDSIAITVEAGDERAQILTTLVQLAGRRVIVVLSDDAVFHRPGDLREVEQAAVSANVELVLVIAGNERLRLWARAQGFRVFSSVEMCARSQSSSVSSPLARSSGQFKAPGVAIAQQTPRVTEPLYARPEVQRVPNPVSDVSYVPYTSVYGHMQSPVQAVDTRFADVQLTTDTPVNIQLVDVQQALHRQIAEEKAQDRISQPFSLLPNAEIPVPVADVHTLPQAIDSPTPSARGATRTLWHDRLLFILVALLVLGIMGGLSFGYLLSLAHLASAPILLASLSLVSQVVQL